MKHRKQSLRRQSTIDPPNPLFELQPHQRDPAKESQILVWIWNLLGEISTFDYDQYLRDGVTICRLMNAIKPGAIPGKIEAGSDFKTKRSNIQKFLKACQDYGVPRNKLFDPDDLLLLRHLPKVTNCIFALGEISEEDDNFEGPYLGEEPYEAVNKAGRRRGGMPFGDDIYVAHVSIKKVKEMLAEDAGKDANFT